MHFDPATAAPSDDLVPLVRPDEAARRQRLRRNKQAATGLLAAIAGLLLLSHAVPDPGFWTLLWRAGAEAGLVGGIADWFAVTAIFRHPLGLPIPHTGIVAAQKDRIGRGIGGFVERNFLAPQLIAQRMRAIEPASRLGQWLSNERNASDLVERIIAAGPGLLGTLQDRDLRAFVGRALGNQLGGLALAPRLGRALHLLTSTGEYDALFDRSLDAADELIRRNADRIEAIVARHSRWWVPKAIDRRITQTILQGLHELIEELRRPENAGRQEFRRNTQDLIEDLLRSPEHRARVEEVKSRLLAHPEVQAWLHSIWDQVRDEVVKDLAEPAAMSRTRSTIVAALTSCGHVLADDPAMRTRLNEAIEAAIVRTAGSLRTEIGVYIADVVRGWDTGTISDRLELAVGSDLQYVRINGTLVGGCVGCVLFLVERLFA